MLIAWLLERARVVRGAMDGSADKLWAMYQNRIRSLEHQLREVRADRDMLVAARDVEANREALAREWLQAEQRAHGQTRARLLRAAKRVVRQRDELEAALARIEQLESLLAEPIYSPSTLM